MPLSPRTNQFQGSAMGGGGGGATDAAAAFEQGFTQMAYQVLMAKQPDLVQDVVTFKVLHTDLDTGAATGTFVVMRNGDQLYIPVVLANNQIKPLDIVYNKKADIFVPLTQEWLAEMDKLSMDEMGEGVKTPDTLYSDVDIRNIVVPPVTGRFSYASFEEDATKILSFTNLEKTAERKLLLMDFLTKAPNLVKVAFARVLEKQPKLLKKVAEIYGVKNLVSALKKTVTKTAALQMHGGGLWIADKDTKPVEFKRIFGDKAPEAFRETKLKGYAAKDMRTKKNIAVEPHPYKRLEEPSSSGVWRLHTTDGDEKPALVVVNPVYIHDGNNSRYGKRDILKGHVPAPRFTSMLRLPHTETHPHETGTEFLVVFPGGKYFLTQHVVGESGIADDISGQLYKAVFGDAGTPKAGKGFFVRTRGMHVQATAPLTIKSIATDSSSVRRIVVEGVMGYGRKTLVTDPKHPVSTLVKPQDSDLAFLPQDFLWVPLGEEDNEDLYIRDLTSAQRSVLDKVASLGYPSVYVKSAGCGQYSIQGQFGIDKISALGVLARAYRLDVDDAAAILKKADETAVARFYVVPPEVLKMGADEEAAPKKKAPKKEPAADEGAPPEGDPNAEAEMAAQQQAAMAPPAPATPTPADLAAMEMQHALQQEMQKIQEKQVLLSQLAQRTNEIAGGAPPTPAAQAQAMGAPPMQPMGGQPPAPDMGGGQPPMPPMGQDPSQMGGQPPMPGMDPNMGGQPPMPGMDPNMGGQPPMPGMEQGMDPSQMGGQPGMDPSQMAAQPMPGQDPNQMGGQPGQGQPQQPPMAMMPEDGGMNSANMESAINPQFLQQAGQLQSDDVFDSAAIANMAQSPMLKDMIGQYIPSLEQSLDNICRVTLSLWMKETEVKGEIGEDTFAELEDNLRMTLKGLGDLVLKLNQNAQVMKGKFDSADQRFPDNRFRFVRQSVVTKTPPENSVELALYDILRKTAKNPDVAYAMEIYSKPYERNVLNAWLLAGANELDVETHLRVPAPVAHIYMHLFFDVTQFRDELDIYSWVNELEADPLTDPYSVQLMKQALMGGLEAMIWIYSRTKTDLDHKRILENILADSYFRARMNRQAPITSKAAREAHTYMATALKAGDLLAKSTPQQVSGISDLVIKLETRDLTLPAGSIDSKDLLH